MVSKAIDRWTKPDIDQDGGIALYRQIKQDLALRIQKGDLRPGEALPSEAELGEHYGVSRPTVRQATQDLIREGQLVIRRGVGTFVAPQRVRQQLGSFLGFTDKMVSQGRRAATRVLERGTHRAGKLDAAIASELQVESDSSVLRVIRLRLADDIPVMVETMHISLDRFPGIQKIDLERVSLYQVLRDSYGVRIVQLRETLEPVILSATEAKLLGTGRRTPSIQAAITSFDSKRQPIEHTISRVRGDASQYYIEVGGGKSASRVRLRQPQLEVSLE